MALQPELFLVERDGRVVIWKYNNPPKNLWSAEAETEYGQLMDELDADPTFRAGSHERPAGCVHSAL